MRSTPRLGLLALAILAAPPFATACGPSGRRDTGATPTEDAALEAALDVAPDAETPDVAPAPDAPPDALLTDGSDAPLDAATDAPLDARLDDAPLDAALDAPSEATAPADASDAFSDGSADAGETSSISSCTMPVRSLVTGDEIVGHAEGPSRVASAMCAPSTPGPEAYFTFYNGSPSRWFFSTDDPRTTADTVISVREICAEASSEIVCSDDRGARAGTTSLTYPEYTRRGYAVIVDRKDGTEPFDYVLRARQVTLASNYRCGPPNSRLVAANGANVTGENLEASGTYASACGARDGVTQLFYRVAVPAHTQTSITVTPTGPLPTDRWRPYIRGGHGCDIDCTEIALAHANGEPATAIFANDEATERTFWFSVSSYEAFTFGTFRVSSANDPTTTGDSCARPEALGFSSPLRGRTTDQTHSIGFGCDVDTLGGQSWYSVEVPAGRRARVTVTPTGADPWSALLRHADTCPELRCLGAAASSVPGAPVAYTFTNAGTAPRTYAFAVSARAGGSRTYDIDAELLSGAVPYVESLVTARCDTLPGDAPLVFGSPADDLTSVVSALPFAFQFFGERATHYALSSNGFMQLFNTGTAIAVTAPGTSVLPSESAPHGIVAPYWSDLAARTPGGELRTGTVSDAAGRRFVAHWNSYQVRTVPTTLLSFQVKLFESSNAVELHYCALNDSGSPTLVQGAYSTTGIQDFAGIEGVTFARNARSSLDPTRAIRYEPRP